MNNTRRPHLNTAKGLTLIELVVALAVGAVVAAVVAGIFSSTVRASTQSKVREEARRIADYAASTIAADIASVVRDGDLYNAMIRIDNGEAGNTITDELLLFTHSPIPVRTTPGPSGGTSEGAVYEVQYRLAFQIDQDGNAQGLILRRGDAAPDETFDGGGTVTQIASRVLGLSFEAFDGAQWQRDWESDRDGIPHAVRFELTVEAGTEITGIQRATVRKTIAIDRVPLPYVTLAPEDRGEEDEEAAR